MSYVGKSSWVLRMVSAALAGAVLIGGLGPASTDSVEARKRASPKLVQDFSVSGPIPMNNGGVSQSTPSTILVSGFETEVADVNITLFSLNHTQAGNIDALLIGPGGQTALFLSDVGSTANNVTITFDDQAASQVSSTAALSSGTFQPTNFQSAGDNFFPPAPNAPSSGSELGVFNSTSPNGVWTLYLRDDGGATTGVLSGGWNLRITSANGVPDASPDSFQANAGKPLNELSSVLDNDSDPDNDILTAILAGKPKKGTLQLAPDGTFTYKSSKKAKGTDSFTYLAQDPGGLSDLETATISIKKAKKKGKK